MVMIMKTSLIIDNVTFEAGTILPNNDVYVICHTVLVMEL